MKPLHPIVQRALTETVCNIGQLTTAEKYQLNKAVKAGLLVKLLDYTYPCSKIRYVNPAWCPWTQMETQI